MCIGRGSDDNLNLKSQMAACSFSKLTITPATGTGVVGGVAEVRGQACSTVLFD